MPTTDTRDSGISPIGALPWGSHFCQFFKTKRDLVDILVPYFAAGLENNELCVWVTSDFVTEEDAVRALKQHVPRFASYLERGQIEIFPYTNWYLKGGSFDQQKTLSMWMEKHDAALSSGFAGLRVSGNPYWIDTKKDWDDFASYEAEINNVIGGTKLLVLCTYSRQKCGVAEIMDVIKNHEFALGARGGTWQVTRTCTVHVTAPRERRPALVEALSKMPGGRLDAPPAAEGSPSPTGPATLVLHGESTVLVDALRGLLDQTSEQELDVRVDAGPHRIDMRQFCLQCQADESGGQVGTLRPCTGPSPSTKEWCPLAFALRLRQAGQEVG
ncbi:MAG: MEDS domain-containing protein [Chloroflexi bacterium]|nr:MEDS domain-containing protein [Chloroflexota bacterium]